MSIALWVKVETLEKRVEALERAQAKPADRLLGINAARRASGAKLRQAIERIVSAHPDLSSKQVLEELASIDVGRTALPSVRTVQWHIRAVRNASVLHKRGEIPASPKREPELSVWLTERRLSAEAVSKR